MFADRLIEAIRQHGPLCVGIDPHAGRIPELFGGDTPKGLAAWGMAVAETAAGRVAAVKPQVALFERHGSEGMAALQVVADRAREVGLLIIMDAKRGDIGSTAEGYASAYLAEDAPFASDALTVNPYMGLDTLEPFLTQCEQASKGLAVLARTSNPGAADFQALDQAGAPVWTRIVEALSNLSPRLKGESGWSGLMLVAGATGPEEARAMRAVAPDWLFLVPGYGAQGAGAAEAVAGFVEGPAGLEGGLVNASRSVTFPEAARDAEGWSGWQAAIRSAIEAAQSDLKRAVSLR